MRFGMRFGACLGICFKRVQRSVGLVQIAEADERGMGMNDLKHPYLL